MSKYTYQTVANAIDQMYFPNVNDQREVRKAVAAQMAKAFAGVDPKFNKLTFMRMATNNPAR